MASIARTTRRCARLLQQVTKSRHAGERSPGSMPRRIGRLKGRLSVLDDINADSSRCFIVPVSQQVLGCQSICEVGRRPESAGHGLLNGETLLRCAW